MARVAGKAAPINCRHQYLPDRRREKRKEEKKKKSFTTGELEPVVGTGTRKVAWPGPKGLFEDWLGCNGRGLEWGCSCVSTVLVSMAGNMLVLLYPLYIIAMLLLRSQHARW